MIDNAIIFWMCFIVGWVLVVFAGIGGIWLIIKCFYADAKMYQKCCEWKKKADKWDAYSVRIKGG